MKLVPVTNTEKNFLHIGGKVIAPGETHLIDARIVPAHLLPKESAPPEEASPAPPQTDEALIDLAAGTVAQIVPQLTSLSDDDLLTLQALEMEGGNRKGVLDAIEVEKLERATRPAPDA